MPTRGAGDLVEVVIDGRGCGRVRVADLFPPDSEST